MRLQIGLRPLHYAATAMCVLALAGCGGDCLNPAGCNKGDGPGAAVSNSGGPPASSGTYAITYGAAGSIGSVKVTYFDPNGGTSTEVVNLPWQKQFYGEKGAVLFLSAEGSAVPGTVTINIFANGSLLGSGVGTGPNALTSVTRSCC